MTRRASIFKIYRRQAIIQVEDRKLNYRQVSEQPGKYAQSKTGGRTSVELLLLEDGTLSLSPSLSTFYASRIKSFKLLTMRDTTFQVHQQNLERPASLPANASYFRG